jgi:hypothetical protein
VIARQILYFPLDRMSIIGRHWSLVSDTLADPSSPDSPSVASDQMSKLLFVVVPEIRCGAFIPYRSAISVMSEQNRITVVSL